MIYKTWWFLTFIYILCPISLELLFLRLIYVNTDVRHIMQRIIERNMFLLQKNAIIKPLHCKPFNFETEAVLTLLWSNLPSLCHYYPVPQGNCDCNN